jgi:hypothetical protein
MTATKLVERPADTSGAGRWTNRGWAAVASIPVFFVLALAVGYVVYDLFGYRPENSDAPLWVDLVCSIPVLAVALVPCLGAVHFGRKAKGVGDRRGTIPLTIGALAGIGLTVLTLVTLIAG